MSGVPIPVFSISDFEKSGAAAAPFYINTFSRHLSENTFLSWPYRHNFYILLYFTEGECDIHVDFIRHSFRKGSLILMTPGQVHRYVFDKEPKAHIIFFGNTFLDRHAGKQKLFDFSLYKDRSLILDLTENEDLEHTVGFLFQKMMTEYEDTAAYDQDIIRDCLDMLVLHIFRQAQQNDAEESPQPRNWTLKELDQLIETHFMEHHPPAFYSNMLHISTKYLNQLSKKHLQKTTTQLIHERLALEAKRLLIHENLSSNQVADKLNFDDHSYFTRFFKKVTGVTPGEFKRSFKS